MSRRYMIRTFGCQMNSHDSGRAAGLLESMGYRPAQDADDADLVLVNTCAVRENADNRLYGTLGHLKQLKDDRRHAGEDLTIVVGGCLAQKDGAHVAERAPWVDVVYGTHNLASLPALLTQADSASLPIVELVETLETFPSALPARRDVHHHAWVSISVGCDNTCTFCIVPSLRGPERSRRVGDIVAEVESLVADDVIEVTLLGQNVNSYGRDLTGSSMFADLLRELGNVDGLERIRFTSPHPRDFTEDVLDAMADVPAVCPHLHLPLQSGSDRVLKLMRRSYRQRRYLDLVVAARDRLDEPALTTDIIVGFPGETEEDFEQTLDVVDQVRFDQAFTFKYSPRPGTPAAEMRDDFIADEVIAQRYDRLEALVRGHSHDAHTRLIGRRVELLIEGPSKSDPSRLSGRTPGNHLVHVPHDPAMQVAPGDFVTTEVLNAAVNYALAGEILEVRRTRAGDAVRAGRVPAVRPGNASQPPGGTPDPGRSLPVFASAT